MDPRPSETRSNRDRSIVGARAVRMRRGGPLWSPVPVHHRSTFLLFERYCPLRVPSFLVIRLHAAPGASPPALLRLVFGNRGDLALDVLQHGVNLWPGQKARTPRLIRDALCQFLDEP